jgi:hypothetical protein
MRSYPLAKDCMLAARQPITVMFNFYKGSTATVTATWHECLVTLWERLLINRVLKRP